MDPVSWGDAMQPAPEDDFQQFLDMYDMANMADGIQFDYQEFHNPTGADMMHAPHRQPADAPMTGTDTPDVISTADPGALRHQMSPMTTTPSYQSIPTSMMPPPTPDEALVDSIDAQIQFLQQQKLQHQHRQLEEQQAAFLAHQQARMVPPTPQSLELQAGTSHFYSQAPRPDHTPQQHPVDYRYQRVKDQQEMSFTPLVSPAVTPLETHFSMDAQFTVPGAYFSPLTSPALHAQNDTIAAFENRHGSVNTSSPRDNMDLGAAAATAPVLGLTPSEAVKKPRTGTKKRGKGGVRQSPIVKPQRRKTTTTPLLNAQMLSELVENAEQQQDQSQQLPVPAISTSSSSASRFTDSENNSSVSPQNLDDVCMEMPPPPVPKPRSAKPSPRTGPEHHVIGVQLPGMPSPATPASLMKLSSPSNRSSAARVSSQEQIASDHIENFELPESANFPKEQNLSVVAATPEQPSPEPSSAKGSSVQPSPSPIFAKPAATTSASQSPQLAPGSGSLSAKKTPQLTPRGSKKRGSVASIQVSPALRPRISPSIKPLVPGGSTAEDAASHLLATKSNYQRLLEGNTMPGMSYPSDLSTNLTSKRTSHKIAEQGRRNRINSALQEIATLLPLPPSSKDAKDTNEGDGGDKKDANGNAPNSKASTVELAIEYIKQLKDEVAEANRRAEEAEKKLELAEKA